MSPINLSFTSSFVREEEQFKETINFFLSDKGKYLAVKENKLCKINLLQLIWEKVKGIFLGKDATNTHVINLTALEWIVKGAKCIQSLEDYRLVEELARQAGLIPLKLKRGPENIQELTKEIVKKLFPVQQKKEETTDNSPHPEEMAQKETAHLLKKFIKHYEKQLNRFQGEVEKARQTLDNIYQKNQNHSRAGSEKYLSHILSMNPPETKSSPSTSDSPFFNPTPIKKIPIKEGTIFNVEPAAMLACHNVEIKTEFNCSIRDDLLNGSLWNALKKYFGGEGIFKNKYHAKEGGGWVALEEEASGQMTTYTLEPGKALMIETGAYVASDENVKISALYTGISGWWKGLSFTKLHASTNHESGRVFFNSMSGIVKVIKISKEDGAVIVPSKDVIAYTNSLSLTARKLGGFVSSRISGEGTVHEFKGDGLIFVGSADADKEHFGKAAFAYTVKKVIHPGKLVNRFAWFAFGYVLTYTPLKILAEGVNQLGNQYFIAGNATSGTL